MPARMQRLVCFGTVALTAYCGNTPAAEDARGTWQAWYWDSVVNIHFDNGGRPLAKGMSVDRLTLELASIPAGVIQVCVYGGDGWRVVFPWEGNIRGFAQPDPWDSLAVWSEVARRTGKRFHLYTNTFNGITPEALAEVNPQYRGARYGAGYRRFMQDVGLPILKQALARYRPQGVWVDGSEALVHDPAGFRQQIADLVHQQNSAAMVTFNHSWLNLVCGWPDPRTPPPYVDTLSFDRVPAERLAHCRVQGMFYSSFDGIPHDMMHCVDRPGHAYEELLRGGALALASGGSWFLWVDKDKGIQVVESLEIVRKAARWAIQRKPALGRTHSANPTAVLVSETQWKEGGRTYGKLGSAGLVWDDEVPLVQACALALQDRGFLVDIVNEEILVQHPDRYRRVFVPGQPKLGEAAKQTLRALESREATVVRNAPARPDGHARDVQVIDKAAGCVFSLRQQVGSNRYVLHVVDLREQKRSGMSCSLPLPARPRQVQAYPSSVKVEHRWSNGRCTITLGEFEVHAAIALDCGIRHPMFGRDATAAGAQPVATKPLLRDGEGGSRLPPSRAYGYPSRAPDLDVLPGFRSPPPGYGQVPLWWWTGDPLRKQRLLWQIEELHRKGVSGMSVIYAHEDTPGWPTCAAEPEIFSDQWWDIWGFVAKECSKRTMGIGLSGYTLDWPNGKSLLSRTVYSETDIQGREIKVPHQLDAADGEAVSIAVPADAIGVRAYRVKGGRLEPGGADLANFVTDGRLNWTAPEGRWQVWIFTAPRKPGTLNPMHPLAGKRMVEKFFQRFEDHAPGQSPAGLNYFFQDELKFGVGHFSIWCDDFPAVFRARKGYDVFDVLPAMFTDIGPRTIKARLDFLDVRVRLSEERYFIPIFNWHWTRGKIYGCDQGGRGRIPTEFGDYFSSVRWFTAPGHDTPGDRADLIKGKVSSSIAQLYQRPRVWLEGYHSMGWGATPQQLMFATRENYLYGCTLLNLHGLYYTTHGGFWEWAPPCYHFHMPYWEHMDTFLEYFERLSYLLSQGVHCCDIAVMYPVSPGQAQMGGKEATDAAFRSGTRLVESGYDFLFMDDESLVRAEVRDGRLHVSDSSYRVLVLPALRAIRWATLQKALAFYRAGGVVINVGALPEASDRAGREDRVLDAAVKELFGATAAEVKAGQRPSRRTSAGGGVAAVVSDATELERVVSELVARDVQSDKPVKALHRKIGPRDVYMVMGAAKGSVCAFRAKGRVELWDPWTGKVQPIYLAEATPEGTRVRMPLEEYEAQVIVFNPGDATTVQSTDLDEVVDVETRDGLVTVSGFSSTPGRNTATVRAGGQTTTVTGEAAAEPATLTLDGPWEFELKPTLDNRWGDFRLPVTDRMIAAEARFFRYAEEHAVNPGWEKADFDDSAWPRVTYGFGPQFWKLGPLPKTADLAAFEAQLAAMKQVDSAKPVEYGGRKYAWQPYAFSWRWGVEGDPGHQGWHGLKEKVTDDFICLGAPKRGHNETLYVNEPGGTRCYLWSTVRVADETKAKVFVGGLKPAAVFLNGARLGHLDVVKLLAGANALLLRFDASGRGHFVLEQFGAPESGERTPLSMQWYDRPGVLRFDTRPTEKTPAGWYRFASPPGLREMTIQARGKVQVWADGKELETSRSKTRPNGVTEYAAKTVDNKLDPSKIALRVEQQRGSYSGAALPEPVRLDCAVGSTLLGDWSQNDSLASYSGGAWYRKTIALKPDRARGQVILDLGNVVATAEVHVNGRSGGVRVAPPWTLDISELVRAGENRIEILVYNTLANHYLTIPTRFRGSTVSGLLGPVTIRTSPQVVLEQSRDEDAPSKP